MLEYKGLGFVLGLEKGLYAWNNMLLVFFTSNTTVFFLLEKAGAFLASSKRTLEYLTVRFLPNESEGFYIF